MRKRSLAVALATGLLLTGACGDDEDDGSTTETTAAAADEGGSSSDEGSVDGEGSGGGESAAGGDFCTAYLDLLADGPTAEGSREVAELAPDPAAEALEAMATGMEEDPEGFFDSEVFSTNFATLNEVVNEECADEVIDVTAVEYAFEGVPSEVPAGRLGIDFANDGAEFHEIALYRKNDGVTQSFQEILDLGEEEARGLVTELGGGFAPPGETSGALFDVSEPGDYAFVCFVPVGATPDAPEDIDGPPHFTQGMLSEFRVS